MPTVSAVLWTRQLGPTYPVGNRPVVRERGCAWILQQRPPARAAPSAPLRRVLFAAVAGAAWLTLSGTAAQADDACSLPMGRPMTPVRQRPPPTARTPTTSLFPPSTAPWRPWTLLGPSGHVVAGATWDGVGRPGPARPRPVCTGRCAGPPADSPLRRPLRAQDSVAPAPQVRSDRAPARHADPARPPAVRIRRRPETRRFPRRSSTAARPPGPVADPAGRLLSRSGRSRPRLSRSWTQPFPRSFPEPAVPDPAAPDPGRPRPARPRSRRVPASGVYRPGPRPVLPA